MTTPCAMTSRPAVNLLDAEIDLGDLLIRPLNGELQTIGPRRRARSP